MLKIFKDISENFNTLYLENDATFLTYQLNQN